MKKDTFRVLAVSIFSLLTVPVGNAQELIGQANSQATTTGLAQTETPGIGSTGLIGNSDGGEHRGLTVVDRYSDGQHIAVISWPMQDSPVMLERTDDLRNWTEVTPILYSEEGVASVSVRMGEHSKAFFRLRRLDQLHGERSVLNGGDQLERSNGGCSTTSSSGVVNSFNTGDVICFKGSGNQYRCNGASWVGYTGPADCAHEFDNSSGVMEPINEWLPTQEELAIARELLDEFSDLEERSNGGCSTTSSSGVVNSFNTGDVICFKGSGNQYRCNGASWVGYTGPADCAHEFDNSSGVMEPINEWLPARDELTIMQELLDQFADRERPAALEFDRN